MLNPKLTGLSFLAALSGTVAQAETYALATFFEPTHTITRYQHVEFAERVKEISKGEITFEVYTGGILMPPTGTLEGVAAGVAQASVIAPSYTPSALPVMNAVHDLGWMKPDPLVLALATADFNFNEAAPQRDWKNNGVLYGAGHATPSYNFMCRTEVAGLADLKGVKTRTPGASYVRFGDSIGLTAVNLAASEIYIGLERGALDCVIGDLTHLQTGSTVGDLVKSIITLPMSPYFTSAGLVYNRDFWRSLRDDQRRLLLEEGARSTVRLTLAYQEENRQALEWGRANGIAVHEPDAALQAAYDSFVSTGMGNSLEYSKTTFGISDPEALFASYSKYIDRWDALLKTVDRNNAEAVYALVKAEMIDGVDVATYGFD